MKTARSILLSVLCLVTISGAAHADSLGLAERRALKEYQDTKFPELDKKVDEAAGFDVKLTVEWDKLAQAGEADAYSSDDYFTASYFTPLIEALKQIAKDDMGKNALDPPPIL